MKLSRIAYLIIIAIGSIVILLYSKALLIPFITALFIWFLIKEIRQSLQKIGLFGKNFPGWLQSTLAAGTLFLVLGVVIHVLTRSIQELSTSLPAYEANIESITARVNDLLGVDIISSIKGYTREFDFGTSLQQLISSLTELFGNAFMVLIYVLFLLLEEAVFSRKLEAIYPDAERRSHITALLAQIDTSVGNYITLKTLVNLMSGTLTYITLLIIGVDAAFFWAFLVFLLTYIPIIGAFIGVFFPATFALLQFGEFLPCFLVLGIVGTIQVTVGNIVEPRIMGNSLNISSLVVILSLSFWGAIWGITGMILSVPITVVAIIILAQFPKTKAIAIMLSEKGRLKNKS